MWQLHRFIDLQSDAFVQFPVSRWLRTPSGFMSLASLETPKTCFKSLTPNLSSSPLLCVSVQFIKAGTFETVWQAKYYNYYKREHCQFGNKFSSIEYECKPNETRTLMWINKEAFNWLRPLNPAQRSCRDYLWTSASQWETAPPEGGRWVGGVCSLCSFMTSEGVTSCFARWSLWGRGFSSQRDNLASQLVSCGKLKEQSDSLRSELIRKLRRRRLTHASGLCVQLAFEAGTFSRPQTLVSLGSLQLRSQ